MESLSDVPVFPLRVIDLTAPPEPDQYFHNLEELGCSVEAGGEWDSDDPEMAKEVLLLDAHNRRVRLIVRRCEVQVCELYEDKVWNEEAITEFVEAMRSKWRQQKDEQRPISCLGRLVNHIRRLWKLEE